MPECTNPNEPIAEEERLCEGCSRALAGLLDCSNCEQCMACCNSGCNCYNCGGCDTRVSIDCVCSNCSECDGCCSCYCCCNCSESFYSIDFCTNCDCCLSCCQCDSEQHCELIRATDKFWPSIVEPKTGKIEVDYKSLRNKKKTNPSSRFCSVEIEVARLDIRDYSYKISDCAIRWGAGIVSDGSLPETGFEINTAPAAGDYFVNQIEEFGNALTMCEAKVTPECGLHVHIDARDFGWWEIRRLIMLYAKIESTLFSIVPTRRRRSTYCLKCGDVYLKAIQSGKPRKIKEAICQAVYKQTDVRAKRENKYDDARYYALNLHSWFYRGTVECRLFDGCVDQKKIINWGILWSGILDWVYNHKEKDLHKLDGKTGLEILLEVCPTEEVRKWVQRRNNYYNS